MWYKNLLFFTFMIGVCIHTAHATDPTPPDEAYQRITEEINQTEADHKKLQKQQTKTRKDLAHLQEELVVMAKEIGNTKQLLQQSEKQLAQLSTQEIEHKRKLAKQQDRTNRALHAMIRLSRVPPEALITMPGTIRDFSYTSITLENIITRFTTTKANLEKQIKYVREISDEVKALQHRLAKRQNTLTTKQKNMQTKLALRNKLHQSLNTELKQHEIKIATLSKQSKSLQELITRLEKAHTEHRAHLGNIIPVFRPTSLHTELPKRQAGIGQWLQLPVGGTIVSGFGATNVNDSYNKGIRIRTQPGLQVTAPSAGKIAYTGPFMSYGNIVIIRHSDAYHTLIAGLASTNVAPGQFVLEGEPIGVMGKNELAEDHTHLYMELRKYSQPVDPEPWLSL